MRRVLLLALLVLLALVVPACGGGDDDAGGTPTGQETEASSQVAVIQAASRTAESSSARFSFSASLSGGAVEGSWSGEGAIADQKGKLTLDLSGLGAGAGAFARGKTEMVTDGLVAYMKVPPSLAQALPGEKAWIKMDLAKLGEAQGIDLAQLVQFNQSNPIGALRYLRGATQSFQTVGAEEVRGVATTRYHGTIDLRKVAAEGPPEVRKAYERVVEISGVTTIPVDVWVDADGLARRIQYEQPLGSGQGELRLTMDLYDFGVDVDVEIPPAKETLDLMQLLGGTQ
jgi:hypothetical protein